jgi:hypothetical protein
MTVNRHTLTVSRSLPGSRFEVLYMCQGVQTPLNSPKQTMPKLTPTPAQINRFELKHQDCAGPYYDGSYVSVVTGKRYTAHYIARTYGKAWPTYNGIYIG